MGAMQLFEATVQPIISSWLIWPVLLLISVLAAVVTKKVIYWSTPIATNMRLLGGHAIQTVTLDGLHHTRTLVLFAWYFSLFISFLDVNTGRLARGIHTFVVLATCFQTAIWSLRAIDHWKSYALLKASADGSTSSVLGLVTSVMKGGALIVVLLLGLGNLGVDIAALVASFGIGGVAVALAARNILEDLLASVSIVLDKPFVVGDFISVGDKQGTVESLGIKTTRVRALSGELIVFSNKDLLNSRIQNFKELWKRRSVQRFVVVYSTPMAKLERIPDWLKGTLANEPKVFVERAHLSAYSQAGVEFELVFLLDDSDYNLFMDIQQKLLLRVNRIFEDNGVSFATTENLNLIRPSPAPRSVGHERPIAEPRA